MPRFLKIVGVSFAVGMLGVILSVPRLSLELQEQWELKLLFRLRGARQPPSEVILVAMDRESLAPLQLSAKTQSWPRKLHARLVERLTDRGAAVIVFDLLFDEDLDADGDMAFAAALADSGRVVLCEALHQAKVPISDAKGRYLADLNIETVVPPILPLARSALASAPFPLPIIPVQLNQFWLFKPGAGNVPTLPVVAFFIFASKHYDAFFRLVDAARSDDDPTVPPSWEAVVSRGHVVETLLAYRELLSRQPSLGSAVLDRMKASQQGLVDPSMANRIQALVGMLQSQNSRHLNFYGPAGTLLTYSYHEVLMDRAGSRHQNGYPPASGRDLEGKVVFVGLSDNLRPQRKDGYHTVFSKNGIDLSGVEIAATAFANLLENRLLRPLDGSLHLLAVFSFGVLLGLVCFSAPVGAAAGIVVSLGSAVLLAAHLCFSRWSIWIPVIVPVFLLTPISLVAMLVGRYCVVNKERRVIRKAFGFFLPDTVIDHLARNVGDFHSSQHLVYGICLYTDAQQYAALSESMDPKALSRLMNSYYERLFVPVKRHGGVISDVVGDSMMAIWARSKPDPSLRAAACHAALGIVAAAGRFNREFPAVQLKTRIGMHAGHIVVGTIGAVDHYEYRPVGDIVNTASRMEGLNKHLGTQILASDQVLHRLDGFLTRNLGEFLPYGKTNAVLIHELLGEAKDISPEQEQLCSHFETGLRAFRNRDWEAAMAAFDRALDIYKADGPSIFFKQRCQRFKENPPEVNWDGIVDMKHK